MYTNFRDQALLKQSQAGAWVRVQKSVFNTLPRQPLEHIGKTEPQVLGGSREGKSNGPLVQVPSTPLQTLPRGG